MEKIRLLFKDVIFAASFAISILLFVLPYYLILPQESYIPKRIPALGYFMPKTTEAWLFLIGALIFLVIAIARAFALKKRKEWYNKNTTE